MWDHSPTRGAVNKLVPAVSRKSSASGRYWEAEVKRDGGITRRMFKRPLQPHEELIIAVHEIERDPEYVSFDGLGVTSDDLRKHWRTKQMTDAEILAAVKLAQEAGWLLHEPRIWAVEEIQRIRLNDVGINQCAALTEPWWRAQSAALARDLRGALVSGVVSMAISVSTVLILS